jgi:DNA polymerase-4
LRFDDYTRATRSHTMPEPTVRTPTVLAAGRELLAAAMPLIERRGLTLLGVALTNLADDANQLALPLEGDRAGALDIAVDGVRERFGSGVLTRAVHLGRDQGYEMPLLPD